METGHNALRGAALTLANIAIETQNYVTDVLHHVKASGVAEIISAHEAGNPPDIAATIARCAIPAGNINYVGDYIKEFADICAEAAEEVAGFSAVTPDRYAENLVERLIFQEIKETPLYIETFERRFPAEFRETSFYNGMHDTLLLKLREVFEETEGYRDGASTWARYYAFDTTEKYCLIIWMLTQHGYSDEEIMPIFSSQGERVREFCNFVKKYINNCSS